MKKSDMIGKLYSHLEMMEYKNGYDLANKILDLVEELGMLPPPIIVHPNSYNRTDGTYGFETNEWEPENDENYK